MEVLQLYNALLRRKWLVVQSVAFFFLVAVLLTFLLPKQYQSTEKLIIESSSATSSILSELGLEEMSMSLSQTSDDVTNKIALATMRPILEEVIWNLQLRDSGGALLPAEKLIVTNLYEEAMAAPRFAISNAQGTNILLITATADDAELSALMADTLAQAYIRGTQDRARIETRDAQQFISQQLKVIQTDLDTALGAIADAQRNEEVIDLETEVKAGVQRISEMMLDLEQSLAEIQAIRAEIAERRSSEDRESVDLVSPESIAENAQVRALRQALTELRSQRHSELLEKTEQHPDVILLDRQIKNTIDELEHALREQHELSPTLSGLEVKLVGEEQKAAELRDGIARVTEEFGVYPDKIRRISQLELGAQAAEKLFLDMQEQAFQIAIAETLTVSDLRVVEPAKRPDKHYQPKLLVNVILGVFLGTLFGIALAFVFEYLDDSVKTPDDVKLVWDLPQLGVIPRFGRRDEPRLIVDLPAHDPVSEAFRSIRNSIAFATLDKPPRHIALSSSIPSEGKSTVTLNLAISLARDGKRVVVVDADFRRPTQHRFWTNTSNHVGVTNVLLGEKELSEAYQELPVPGMRLLAAGPLPADPGRLVESLKMRQLLLDVARTCDLVVVDTPPLLVVNDAVVIGRQVDQLLIVTEAGKASRKTLADLRARVEASGLKPLGLILNKLDLSSHYGGYYRYYRDHYAPKGGQGQGTAEGGSSRRGQRPGGGEGKEGAA